MAEPFALTYENLKAWCVRQKFEFRTNDELGQLAIHYTILGQPSPLMVMPQLSRGLVMFAMRQPFQVPDDRRPAIVEATARLNASTFMGAWTVNSQTGELFFRAGAVSLDISYTDNAVLHLARIVVGTSEKAAPALRSIALDGADPAAAVAAVVGPVPQPS